MIKHLLLLVSLLSFHGILKAQITYQKLYTTTNNSQANCIRATSDGGFISCGGGGTGFWILKADSSGNTTWGRAFTALHRILSVKQTSDGGYAACGSWNNGQGKFQAMLIKLNASGALQWATVYGDTASSSAIDLEQTTGGGFLLAGSISSGSPQQDIYLIQTDSTGALQWANRYLSSTAISETASGIISKNNQYYISGNVQVSPTDFDALLLKIDASGQPVWGYRYDVTSNRDFAGEVRNSSDGNLLVIGYTEGSTQDPNALLMKTDTSGAVIWSKEGGGQGADYGSSVYENPDQTIVFAGSADSSAGNRNVLLVKTTNTGNLLWSRQYGGGGLEQVLQNGLDRPADGGYLILSTTIGSFSSGGSKNIYVIKTDPDGISNCNAVPHSFQLSSVTTSRNLYSLTPVYTGSATTINPTPVSVGADSTLCLTTALQEIHENNSKLVVFPNPVINNITIKCEDPVIMLSVYSADGKKVIEKNFQNGINQTTIDIQDLAAGSYILRVLTSSGWNMSKFHKQE